MINEADALLVPQHNDMCQVAHGGAAITFIDRNTTIPLCHSGEKSGRQRRQWD